jgi:hypothetical protein
MKQLMGALVLCALATFAQAADVLREISWASLQQGGALRAGEVRPADASAAFEHLAVKNAEPVARTFTLFKLDRPGITNSRYAIVGEIRYAGVQGTGYLEMLSTFAQKGSFFTRTPVPSDPAQSLSGASRWRAFSLPFDATGAAAPPESLTVNVTLPGRGTVHLGPLRLVEYIDDENPLAVAGAWWSPRTGGLVGGIVGSLLGCMGAVIGLLASRGRGRAVVLGLARGMLALGAVSLVLGVVALFRAQPYDVFYPLLLVGILGVVVPASLIRTLRRRYEELELRKITAQDLSARRPA